jgi:FAD/FMN-containing dehydrogenase
MVAVDELRPAVRGQVLTPEDPGFDDARKVWNGMFDRHPAAIVRCLGAADVIAALRWARGTGLPIAVRAGGHSFPGHSSCDGGIVIDVSPMKGVRVDPAARRAHCGPGLLWGDLDRETQAFGLAVTGGQISHTGIAGLTLGGGLGWLMRKQGLTCDNVSSFDVVTASGDLVRASEKENADLFWALRGGGGNFGIVTNFEYTLHPLTAVVGGLMAFPLPQAPEVLPAWSEIIAGAPDELLTVGGTLTAPDGNKAVAIAVGYQGSEDGVAPYLERFRKLGTVVMEQIGPMPYVVLQTILDASAVPGRRYYMKSGVLQAAHVSRDLAGVYTDSYGASNSPLDVAIIVQMGGAVSRVPIEATAFPHRQAAFQTTILAVNEDPADDASRAAWARTFWRGIEPATQGVYVNELGDEGAERIQEAYGAETFRRLRTIKAKYDPENVFRLNQNIPPA